MKDAVPGVVASGATRTAALLLATVTVTPPCCDAPSVAPADSCSPAPTVCVPAAVMAGPEMVTGRTPVVVIVRTPGGPVTVTVVDPVACGSNVRP